MMIPHLVHLRSAAFNPCQFHTAESHEEFAAKMEHTARNHPDRFNEEQMIITGKRNTMRRDF